MDFSLILCGEENFYRTVIYKNLYSLGRFPPINYFVGGKLFCPCVFFSRKTGEMRDFGLLL